MSIFRRRSETAPDSSAAGEPANSASYPPDDTSYATYEFADEHDEHYEPPRGGRVGRQYRQHAPHRPGSQGTDRHLEALRHALNQALDGWWRRGELPSTTLLRDGLLALEAGHELDESHRTLLLRAALASRKGMLTSLRYQSDPERTALVLHERLVDATGALPAAELCRLRDNDATSREWAPPLIRLLREDSEQAGEPQRTLARAALAELETPVAPADVDNLAMGMWPDTALDAPVVEGEPSALPVRGSWVRAVLLLALAAAIVGVVIWFQSTDRREMVQVPGGSYEVSDIQDPAQTTRVTLAAFAIDRHEVTTAQYRRCYERGVCPWPPRTRSETRQNYLLDPAYAAYPIINVDWDGAERYCRFVGKRLPAAAEWEVAAGYAPATARTYRFPWGDQFDRQRANSAEAGAGDTLQVGTYRAAGDSPFGASDMAGNVAEWTATAVDQDGITAYVVKGGSYADPPDDLRVRANRVLPARTGAPWLGFRCAADLTATRGG
ncbi:MAG: SUMF1/EgtB/PvdO family nonheme iron enzyme [Caldilineaceae bacterium]|nr:SUMF1/EgtB/PvdO family nonheme iron enzyme [Caldilineaceae bacterium]